MHFFQTYCWLLQTLINNVLHPPFHKMQWFSRIIRKQQRTFWFQTKTETKPKTSYSKALVRRKQNQPSISRGGLFIPYIYIYTSLRTITAPASHHPPLLNQLLLSSPTSTRISAHSALWWQGAAGVILERMVLKQKHEIRSYSTQISFFLTFF